MNADKKKKVNFYFIIAIIWYASAFCYWIGSSNSSMGIVFFALGSMWIAIGASYARRQKEEGETADYYNNNAESFIANTENADMSETRNKFTSLLEQGALILDWGCGSGRDTLAFKEAGYEVEATDAAQKLCELASLKTGIEVRNESFEDLVAENKYDGIWACASLLHLEKNFLPDVVLLAANALKSKGVFYLSFKYGDFEGERNGRYFTDLTEESFNKLIMPVKKFEIVEMWVTSDVREGRGDEKWLNVIMRKNK